MIALDSEHQAVPLLEREGLADRARHGHLALGAESSRDFHGVTPYNINDVRLLLLLGKRTPESRLAREAQATADGAGPADQRRSISLRDAEDRPDDGGELALDDVGGCFREQTRRPVVERGDRTERRKHPDLFAQVRCYRVNRRLNASVALEVLPQLLDGLLHLLDRVAIALEQPEEVRVSGDHLDEPGERIRPFGDGAGRLEPLDELAED